MFVWISSNSCLLNLLPVLKPLSIIQGRYIVTWVGVEPRSFDQGRPKNEVFTLLTTLPTKPF